jgi:outer membrane receptor protein involved in Fe transport
MPLHRSHRPVPSYRGAVVGAAFALGLSCLLCAPSSASAAPPAAAARGTLRGVVFGPRGAPLPAVKLAVGGITAQTNRDGAFSLPLPAGRHSLYLWRDGRPRLAASAITVVAGETTEVLVSISASGVPRSNVESPGKATLRRAAKKRGPQAMVRGRVTDAAKGKPIVGARIFARGTNAEATTDAQGRFSIDLPLGKQQLTVIHPNFSTEQVEALVRRGVGGSEVTIALTPAAVALADFTVTAPKITGGTVALLEERKSSATVSELIGAEQMSKSGDSDAAAALSRVTGITVVGGKYVYVRGLGERYSSTLFNRSSLPSPEPERRVVPLDLFAAGSLESIAIQKTYSADLPGEFGGGVVKLRSRGYPSEFTATLTLSLGFNTRTSLYNGLDYQGSGLDSLGFGASSRRIPDAMARQIGGQNVGISDPVLGGGFSGEELERFGEALQNNWNTRRRRVWPGFGLALTVGDSFELGRGHKAGYLFSLSYDNDQQRRIRDHLRFTNLSDGKLIAPTDYRSEEIENTITLSGIASAGFDSAGGHRLRLTQMTARIADDETRVLTGFDDNAGANTRLTRLRYIERMLLFNQAVGHHPLLELSRRRALGLSFDWRYAFSLATRDEPDRREYRYDELPGETNVFVFSNRAGGNQRFFSELSDRNHDMGADLTFAFRQWSKLETKVKLGVALTLKDREVDTRRFQYLARGPRAADNAVLALDPKGVLSPANVGEEGFRFSEATRASDNYLAEQRLWATYVSLDLPLFEGLTLSTGVRVEGSRQVVTTFELFSKERVQATVDTIDVLPALLLSYRPFKSHVFRLGASQVVSRPEFREMSPAGFSAVTGNKVITGNPDLERALLQNVDLRWEWYPRVGESISVALFYKHFSSPIEQTVEPTGGSSQILSPVNAESANNLGVELELRKRLDFIHPLLRDLSFSGNASLIFSRVNLGDNGVQTDDVRPLQGQSPWVFNLFLSYDNADSGTTARLLYNVYGPRIAEVGALGLPNMIEQPFHQLDLVFRQRLSKSLTLAFKAKNLLDLPLSFTQRDPASGDDIVVDGFRRGRGFSIAITGNL